ncbi:DNA-binding protein [Caballeronia terrestris]|jgi:predicted DNA-binding protein with PD1-like motif|uniref:DNA-binding protein n=1 Tax=Caballeronia terrestris TaxID=1226301 RepID=A0A158EYL1_9BURK|nr:PPC domain-containing DNA-binding protein [Caballeronia terrestris]SAL12249.1 DNA-binding protein [Caballeronia terrestris]
MQTLPLRLVPGDDLRASLEAIARSQALSAAFVLQGIGSLSVARLRYAGIDDPAQLTGDFEILTFAGSLSIDGAHLHMSISDRDGRVFGGHVATGCIVRTTAEILIALLPEHTFSRESDPRTGFPELVVRPR